MMALLAIVPISDDVQQVTTNLSEPIDRVEPISVSMVLSLMAM